MRIRFAAVAALVASAAFITTEFASADQYFFRARGAISATSPGGSNGPGDEVSLPPGGTPQNDPLIAQGAPPTELTVGENFSYAFTASGGTAPYTWSATGSLPPGVLLDDNGALHGLPSPEAHGQSYSFSVTVTDAVNQQHSIGPFSVSVNGPIVDAKDGEITKQEYAGTEVTNLGYCNSGGTFVAIDKSLWSTAKYVTAQKDSTFETHFATPVKFTKYVGAPYSSTANLPNLMIKIEAFNNSVWNVVYEGIGYPWPSFPEAIGTKVRLTVTDGEVRWNMPCARM